MCQIARKAAGSSKAGSDMSTDRDPNPAPPNACQLALARELVACLGRESAIHACKVNGLGRRPRRAPGRAALQHGQRLIAFLLSRHRPVP